MWYQWLGAKMATVGSKVSGIIVAIGVAIAGVVLLFFGHKRSVGNARKDGRKTGQEMERERVSRETEEQQATVKEKADEIRENHSNLPDDELRRRMRDAATDKRDR